MKKQNQEIKKEWIIAKKNKGQNFLINPYFINLIVNNIFKFSKVNVLEIGPGTGALTSYILQKVNKFICIEIDSYLVEYLIFKFKNKNLKIIQANILNIDLEKLFLEEFLDNNEIVIISNIPYYITSLIIIKLLKLKNKKIKEIILMMQKEVGERIIAQQNSKVYSSFSVICQFYSDIKKICLVGHNNFIPVPKVDSIVLKFILNKKFKTLTNEEEFIYFIKIMFAKKRKTILNNLAFIINNKKLAEIILLKLSYIFNLRSENLSLNDFYILYNEVKKNNIKI